MSELVQRMINNSVASQSRIHFDCEKKSLLRFSHVLLINLSCVVAIVVQERTINSLYPIHHVTCVSCLRAANSMCNIKELLVSHIVTDVAPVYLVRVQTFDELQRLLISIVQANLANLELVNNHLSFEVVCQILQLQDNFINHVLHDVLGDA